jgi:hypothetical protein
MRGARTTAVAAGITFLLAAVWLPLRIRGDDSSLAGIHSLLVGLFLAVLLASSVAVSLYSVWGDKVDTRAEEEGPTPRSHTE